MTIPPSRQRALALVLAAVAAASGGGTSPTLAAPPRGAREKKPARMPHGSYLVQPAPSGWALQNQVRTSPQVAARYAKAWGISAHQVPRLFAGVRVGQMPRDEVLRVYYYRPKTNQWGYRIRRVRKGTPVFVQASGSTFLVQVCGNPLRPLTVAEKKKLNEPDRIRRAASPGAVVEEFDPHEPEEIPLIVDNAPAPPEGDLEDLAPLAPPGGDPIVPDLPAVADAGFGPTTPTTGKKGFGLPVLLGAAAGTLLWAGASDGLKGPSSGNDTDNSNPPPNLVPEQPSVALIVPPLLTFAGAMGWRQWRKRRRKELGEGE